jgi:hypothetical protein
MINRLWLDLDEVLISSLEIKQGIEEFQYDIGIRVEDDIYHVKINPATYPLLSFSRNLLGKENVWLLTSSNRDYALKINQACDLRFPENQILTREDISAIVDHCRFGPEFKNPHKHKDNILIDNLPARQNEEKMIVGGIPLDNYLQVDDYYGHYQEGWREKIEEFINEKRRS